MLPARIRRASVGDFLRRRMPPSFVQIANVYSEGRGVHRMGIPVARRGGIFLRDAETKRAKENQGNFPSLKCDLLRDNRHVGKR